MLHPPVIRQNKYFITLQVYVASLKNFTYIPHTLFLQCIHLYLYEWAGQSTRLLFVNNTKGTATISLFLSEGSNAKGYWGYIPVPVLAKNQSIAISAPKQGYYYVFAWMNDKDRKYSIQGSFGTNNPDKHEVHLTENGVKVIGP